MGLGLGQPVVVVLAHETREAGALLALSVVIPLHGTAQRLDRGVDDAHHGRLLVAVEPGDDLTLALTLTLTLTLTLALALALALTLTLTLSLTW